MKITELANKYNTTPEQIRAEQYKFLQSEGYRDNGYECETFGEWLDLAFSAKPETTEPFQKGDLNVNNM